MSKPTKPALLRIQDAFQESPKQTAPAFRYGLAALIFAVLVGACIDICMSSHGRWGERSGVPVLLATVLVNHFAFAFSWSPRVTLAMRVFAVSWFVFAMVYLLYLHRMLYPIQ